MASLLIQPFVKCPALQSRKYTCVSQASQRTWEIFTQRYRNKINDIIIISA